MQCHRDVMVSRYKVILERQTLLRVKIRRQKASFSCVVAESAPAPQMSHDVKLRAASTYNAAADFFDAPALSFWDRIGRRTVERMKLKRGAHILDACCGSGASAIPAAEAVGSDGRVLGIDLAENLLRSARVKASRLGCGHAEFRIGDVEALVPSEETFDAVICVFGIFFLPDMPAGVRCLWRLTRPGGKMAITTWGPRVLEPGSSVSGTQCARNGLTSTRPLIHGTV